MLPAVNKKLLPMKGHYLFFNAATAPVIPFLPVMARQLGFSGTMVGIIYTILPIVGMIAKPIMGAIADHFRCKKMLFIIFQIITAVSMLGINYIPEIPTTNKVHFACDNGAAALDTSGGNSTTSTTTDKCAIARILEENKHKTNIYCEMSCDVTDQKTFGTVCKYWNALKYCNITNMPKLEFTAVVPVADIDNMDNTDNIVFFKVKHVLLSDGSNLTAVCPDKENKISTMCDMKCDSPAVNSLISAPQYRDKDVMYTHQFWLFTILAVLAWGGMAVVVSVGDAICFEMLEDKPNLYGNQRLWGAVGWGLFSIFAGLMVDSYSEGESKKNYTSVFYLMLAMMAVDVVISSRLKYTQVRMSASILRDVSKLLANFRILVYLLWCVFVGMCTGFIWQFLFWHLEDLAAKYDDHDGECNMHSWIKTLEGLVMGIQCLGGELPFFFLSGWIIKRVGHVHCMSIVLLGIGIRYVLYSVLVNPWWVLPVELMNGITFGLFYATMASYASIAAPPGTEATIQGLVGAVFEGVGVSLGSLIGGILYDKYGGWITFRIFGISSLVCCLLHFLVQRLVLNGLFKKKDFDSESMTRYAPPNEAIRIFDDDTQELTLADR